jgi:hypothetical protein
MSTFAFLSWCLRLVLTARSAGAAVACNCTTHACSACTTQRHSALTERFDAPCTRCTDFHPPAARNWRVSDALSLPGSRPWAEVAREEAIGLPMPCTATEQLARAARNVSYNANRLWKLEVATPATRLSACQEFYRQRLAQHPSTCSRAVPALGGHTNSPTLLYSKPQSMIHKLALSCI